MSREVVTQCYVCGAEIWFGAGVDSYRCEYCQSINARPQAAVEGSLERANQLRFDGRYSDAERAYEAFLSANPNDHEALWGVVQCRYCVEYVKDPRTGQQLPVCHCTRLKPMQLDPDFQRACKLAPADVRAQFEDNAAYIDNAQDKIRAMQRSGVVYDVFLCYKETDPETGGRTRDSYDAQDIYDALIHEGYKVFYAPQSLRDKVGEDYEAAIYHAIETSQVMLVIGSKPEHFEATWVRSEWSRYLERMDAGEAKRLFPVYRSMKASELPQEFTLRRLQGISMEKLSFMVDLQNAVRRNVRKRRGKPVVRLAVVGTVALLAAGMIMWRFEAGKLGPGAQATEAPTTEPTAVTTEAPTATVAPTEIPTAVPWSYTSAGSFTTEEAEDGTLIITGYRGNDTVVNIPPMINGRAVSEIRGTSFTSGAFIFTNVKEVTIPDGVMRIGDNAFAFCNTLTNVTIPHSVMSIGECAFLSCTALESITIPQSVTSIGQEAFHFCSKLTSVTLPSGITSIERLLFDNCTSLINVTIPNGVTDIGAFAFDACSSLTSIDLPDSVTTIGHGAFSGCSSMKSLTIPASVTTIEAEADFPSDVTIYVDPNSVAEQWAKKYNLSYAYIPR